MVRVFRIGISPENLQINRIYRPELKPLHPYFLTPKCYCFPWKSFGGLALLCIFLVFGFPAPAQGVFKFTEGRKKQKLRFELHRNLIIVEAKLNGKGPFNFLLDTGVNTSIITDAGIQDSVTFTKGRAVDIAGAGAGSDLHAYFASGLKVTLPGITSENLGFAVLSEDVLNLGSYVGIPVAGILGYDFFNSFLIEANFRKLTLILHPPGMQPKKKNFEPLPIMLEENKPYVTTSIINDKQETVPVKLLLDTGAGYALSLECGSEKRVKLPGKTLRSQLGVGLAGVVNGHLGRISALQLGKYQIKQVLASFPDSADVQAKNRVTRNGTLGLELLKRFTVIFDYPHRMLYLKQSLALHKPFEYDLCGLDLVAVAPEYRTFRVTGVHENSAAEAAGILPGDDLISLDLVPVSRYNLTQISRIFHSFPDRKILLILKRQGQLISTEITLKRRI